MNRSRKIFIISFVVFILVLAYASYDISKRTTFPGSKSQLKERIKKDYLQSDSVARDSIEMDSATNKKM